MLAFLLCWLLKFNRERLEKGRWCLTVLLLHALSCRRLERSLNLTWLLWCWFGPRWLKSIQESFSSSSSTIWIYLRYSRCFLHQRQNSFRLIYRTLARLHICFSSSSITLSSFSKGACILETSTLTDRRLVCILLSCSESAPALSSSNYPRALPVWITAFELSCFLLTFFGLAYYYDSPAEKTGCWLSSEASSYGCELI